MQKSAQNIKELSLYSITTKLDTYLDGIMVNFDRYHQQILAKQVSDLLVEMISLVCLAWRIPEKRIPNLREYEARFIVLEYLLKKANNLSLFTKQQYLEIITMLETMGKQMTGWICKTQNKEGVEE